MNAILIFVFILKHEQMISMRRALTNLCFPEFISDSVLKTHIKRNDVHVHHEKQLQSFVEPMFLTRSPSSKSCSLGCFSS